MDILLAIIIGYFICFPLWFIVAIFKKKNGKRHGVKFAFCTLPLTLFIIGSFFCFSILLLKGLVSVIIVPLWALINQITPKGSIVNSLMHLLLLMLAAALGFYLVQLFWVLLKKLEKPIWFFTSYIGWDTEQRTGKRAPNKENATNGVPPPRI